MPRRMTIGGQGCIRESALRIGQRHVAKGSCFHDCLGHELHALIDIGIIGIVVTIKVIATAIVAIISVRIIVIRTPVRVIVVTVTVIEYIVRDTGLTNGERIQSGIPGGERFFQCIVFQRRIVIPISTPITFRQYIPNDIFDGNRIITPLGFVLDNTPCIRIQSQGNFSIRQGFDIILNTVPIFIVRPRHHTPLRPLFPRIGHEVVDTRILHGIPDTKSFVFEQLFKPIVVTRVFKESQQAILGRFFVTIDFGATFRLCVRARRLIPRLVLVIPELVFANATALVIEIDVLFGGWGRAVVRDETRPHYNTLN